MRLVIRRLADRDLVGRADFLARSSVGTARRFYRAARETFERLAGMPGIGSPWETPREELAGMRFCSIEGFRNILVFYLPLEGAEAGIEVVRVLHASQDIEGIFSE